MRCLCYIWFKLNLLRTWNSDMIFFCNCSITKQIYVLIISGLHCIQTNFYKTNLFLGYCISHCQHRCRNHSRGFNHIERNLVQEISYKVIRWDKRAKGRGDYQQLGGCPSPEGERMQFLLLQHPCAWNQPWLLLGVAERSLCPWGLALRPFPQYPVLGPHLCPSRTLWMLRK